MNYKVVIFLIIFTCLGFYLFSEITFPSIYLPIIKVTKKEYLDEILDKLLEIPEVKDHFDNSQNWFQKNYNKKMDDIVYNYIKKVFIELNLSNDDFNNLFNTLKQNKKVNRTVFYIPSYIEKIIYNGKDSWLILYHWGQEDYFDIGHFSYCVIDNKNYKILYFNKCK
ncbi:MAG: hypothetical protein A2086_14085 [Spirochaetes bacterium GWD1_27_9]|nr:MAG: hypothetical protein A2Z98_09685 [Spirochaetes bacterium GWB1_27_13]OHD21338.1 MAG: hypothetical protein A2Y34_10445 [Spirochaetes bacterium GWC1_27_15]OHD35401.1 MAG: hypothetical protein A2086_14085 [Spirochaetes bacterium GWD1_27_9]